MAVVLLSRPSPNFNSRPVPVDCIVLHADGDAKISSSIDYCRTPSGLANDHNPVSYHVLIGRLGDLYQLVQFDKRAWHAGASMFQGRTNVNDFSIGLSFGNRQDGKEPFTEAQYQKGAELCRELMDRYPAITKDRITTHTVVALPPGRKCDPERCGPFDLSYFMGLIP
jgi:N-acetyl-anhydromuramoyl-L-alanine amidase